MKASGYESKSLSKPAYSRHLNGVHAPRSKWQTYVRQDCAIDDRSALSAQAASYFLADFAAVKTSMSVSFSASC